MSAQLEKDSLMPGLDPGIQESRCMDRRVKPGDEGQWIGCANV